jgi:hypothetical protein
MLRGCAGVLLCGDSPWLTASDSGVFCDVTANPRQKG